MGTTKKKRTVKQNVASILSKFEKARNDDKALLLLYWKNIDKVDLKNNFTKDFLLKATPSESITRARRVLQEDGLYLPTEEVMESRKNREAGMRSAVRNREVI